MRLSFTTHSHRQSTICTQSTGSESTPAYTCTHFMRNLQYTKPTGCTNSTYCTNSTGVHSVYSSSMSTHPLHVLYNIHILYCSLKPKHFTLSTKSTHSKNATTAAISYTQLIASLFYFSRFCFSRKFTPQRPLSTFLQTLNQTDRTQQREIANTELKKSTDTTSSLYKKRHFPTQIRRTQIF